MSHHSICAPLRMGAATAPSQALSHNEAVFLAHLLKSFCGQVQEAITSAQREALASFSDDRVLLVSTLTCCWRSAGTALC